MAARFDYGLGEDGRFGPYGGQYMPETLMGPLRELTQKFVVPEYRQPGPGEQDQTGFENPDPRTDPNLHTVFVIARDDVIDGQLGQAWGEFYLRVTP